MLKKILVAVDGSDHSLNAVDYAASIASAMKAELTILFVIKNQALPKGILKYADAEHIIGGNKDILETMAKNIIADAKAQAVKHNVDSITTVIKKGPAARTIVASAKEKGADMIVIGTRGLGNIESTLRGGVSHRVELLSKCPVLSVR